MQTAFDVDGQVLDTMAAALKPGGRLALSAFSAYFQLRSLEEGDDFDASSGVNRERTSLRGPTGEVLETDLWTSCFTPRELRRLADRSGLTVTGTWSVGPGAYELRPPSIDSPEFLLVAERPQTAEGCQ